LISETKKTNSERDSYKNGYFQRDDKYSERIGNFLGDTSSAAHCIVTKLSLADHSAKSKQI